ncbi:MAG: DUF805 domain-containing protein [Hyphomicrobiaceae bacterium]|nr:DUF805 domain-containing protein [Hyphomicrobiaceae bacterium]
MTFARHLALQLVDPRGRADRRDFLLAALALFVLQGLCLLVLMRYDAEAEGLWLLPVNLGFVYMAYAATSRRLHDMDRSAWWMPIAIVVWALAGFVAALTVGLVLGADVLAPGQPGFWTVFACLLSAPVTVAIWLHVTPGSDGSNRFGPPSRPDAGQGDRSRHAPPALLPAE